MGFSIAHCMNLAKERESTFNNKAEIIRQGIKKRTVQPCARGWWGVGAKPRPEHETESRSERSSDKGRAAKKRTSNKTRSTNGEWSELRHLHAPDETESEANAFRQSEVWSTSDDHSYKEYKETL